MVRLLRPDLSSWLLCCAMLFIKPSAGWLKIAFPTEPVNHNRMTDVQASTLPLPDARTDNTFTIPIFPPHDDHAAQNICPCPSEIRPVCGTDGVISYTYVNRCILDCNRKNNTDLRFDYEGHCCDYSHCPSTPEPVCDDKGKLHHNLCYFQFERCTEERKHNRPLVLNPDIKNCRCMRTCTQEADPVCDNLGTTHLNFCYYSTAQCIARVKYNMDLSIAYHGTCCGSLCLSVPQPYFPVCDNTYHEHANFCEFYVAQCISRKKFGQSLQIMRFGKCFDSQFKK